MASYEKRGVTKMIDQEYWNKYYQFWDGFVREWFNQRSVGYNRPQDEMSRAYESVVAELIFDELPTPYLGNPRDGIETVILNLNPGRSEIIRYGELSGLNSDETQYFQILTLNGDG